MGALHKLIYVVNMLYLMYNVLMCYPIYLIIQLDKANW